MTRSNSRTRVLVGCLGLASVCGLALAGMSAGEGGGSDRGVPSTLAMAEPTWHPSFKYLGTGSCAGSECHSGKADKRGGEIGNESTIFSKDPHKKSFDSLKADAVKEAGIDLAKLSISDAATSERCMSCHTLNVPAAQRGPDLKLSGGLGCESCHGPGEKYKDPHKEEGWAAKERAAKGSKGLWSEHGLLDTTDLAARSAMCVTCHLAIDKDLIDAGHPALRFEMYSYNNYNFNDDYKMHWEEPDQPFRTGRMWALGQLDGLKSAKANLEAWKAKGWDTKDAEGMVKLFEAGAGVVKGSLGTDDAAALASGEWSKDKVVAAAKALAAAGEQWNAGDEFEHHRWVITNGIDALVSACGEPGDDYLDMVGKAAEASGDEWAGLIKKMAESAK